MRFGQVFTQVLATAALPALASAGVAGSYSPPHMPKQEVVDYGNITYDTKLPGATFQYNTTKPDGENWIGVWFAFGGGPDNQQKDEEPLAFRKATDGEGTVFFNASSTDPGAYKAYFLDKDYKWLADPVTFSVGPKETKWYTRKVHTRPARRGQEFDYDVSNLVNNAGDPANVFSLVSSNNGGWARITSAGLVYGTPGDKAKDTKMEIQVTTGKNLIYFTEAHIPVRSIEERLISSLKVMTFNMWYGGTQVNDYHNKQVKFILDQNIDLIGLQETQGYHANRLAKALGWYAVQTDDSAIISKYPLEQITATDASAAARVKIDGDNQQVIFWNAHLGYTPYGPYDFCFSNMSPKKVMQREAQSGRTPQIKAITEAMKPYIDNAANVPVFLTGDFNSPSHLDWVESTQASHCGVASFQWPSTVYPTDAGLTDSFREVYPDPATNPGITWSPVYLDNNGRAEPLDRIDFIFYKGGITVQSSEAFVTGSPKAEPNHADNEWTSDHKAVISVFNL